MVRILSHSGISSGYRQRKPSPARGASSIATTCSASASVPAEPSAQCEQTIASMPNSSRQKSRTRACSAAVSLANSLIATTAGTPNLPTLVMWRPRLASPLRTAARFSLPRSSRPTPPCILSARMVATITASSGRQTCLATLDVEELLAAEIGAEAGFRDHVVAQLEGELGRHGRVAAVGDVAERPAVDERRVVLERLHEVRHHGVLQEDGHGAGRLQLLGAHQLTIAASGRRASARAGARGRRDRWPGRTPP